MTSIYGYDTSNLFDDGIITDTITSEDSTVDILLGANIINFNSVDLKHNNVLIPTGSSSVSNPMIADLDAALFNIVNVNQLTTDSIASTDLTRFIDFNTPAEINITTTDLKLNTFNVLTTPLQSDVDCNLKILTNCNGLNTSLIRPLTTNDMEILVNPLFISMQSNILAGDISCLAGTTSGTLALTGYNINLTGSVLNYNSIERNLPILTANLSLLCATTIPAVGSECVYLGSLAGESGSNTSDYNTVVGASSGPGITTGGGNCFIGYQVASNLTTGVNNVCLGAYSGGNLQTNNSNTCLGHNTDIIAGSNSIAIGNSAAASVSNECVIGNSSLTVLRSGGVSVCDLGTTTNKFKNLNLSGSINSLTPTGGKTVMTSAATAYHTSIVETNLLSGGSFTGDLIFAIGLLPISNWRLTMSGNVSALNNDTLTLKFKFNGNIFLNKTIIFSPITNEHFDSFIDFTIRATGAAATAKIYTDFHFDYSDTATFDQIRGTVIQQLEQTLFATTVINTMTITGQWSLSSASNSIQYQTAMLNRLY